MKRKIEVRQSSISAADDSGEFAGYIAVWDTVDSYNSTFTRGAFRKTIEERANKVKVLYNHESLIGRAVDIREDDHGVYARGRINLGLQLGRDVHALMREGDLDGLSFAFQVYQDEWDKGGKRIIKEVRLLEFGPVDFPANDAALITDVRAEQIERVCLRSTDFNANLAAIERAQGLDNALAALHWAAADILSADDIDDKRSALESAADAFGAAFVSWAMDSQGMDEGMRSAAAEVAAKGGPDLIASRTRLMADEVSALLAGKLAAGDVSQIGPACQRLNQKNISAAVRALLNVAELVGDDDRDEIRSTFGADHASRLNEIRQIGRIWKHTI